MFSNIIKSLKRAPIPAVALLLFSALISLIICSLHVSNEAERRNYEEVYRTVPVELTVTNLTGTNSDDLEAPNWVLNVFTGEEYWPVLFEEYVGDIRIKMSHMAYSINGRDAEVNLCGITSLSCDRQLRPENGCLITWNEGYDENIFSGEEPVCIIPEDMREYYDNGSGEVVMDFKYTFHLGDWQTHEYNCSLKITGTYIGGDGTVIYCPYTVMDQIYSALKEERKIDALSATFADNDRLEEFRDIMDCWFVEPSPLGQQTPWGGMGYNYYPYALDIDDSTLEKTVDILQKSIIFNRICTVIVFVLSAVAGFLVGFLMIRRRKRDIILMRTVGESNIGVYFGFVFEQMICIILGIALGGAYNMWNPLDKLLIFAIVYFVGLTLALVIFLRKKLLTTVKEDE